jgi:hypothetical protein
MKKIVCEESKIKFTLKNPENATDILFPIPQFRGVDVF